MLIAYSSRVKLYKSTQVFLVSNASMSADRVLVVAVDDSDDSQRAFEWAVKNIHRPGDELHLVHVIPRLQFAAMLGVPPVDFVPAAGNNNNYDTVVQRAEHFIIERYVKGLPPGFSSPPVVHIIKVTSDNCLGSAHPPPLSPCQVSWVFASLSKRNVRPYSKTVTELVTLCPAGAQLSASYAHDMSNESN